MINCSAGTHLNVTMYESTLLCIEITNMDNPVGR